MARGSIMRLDSGQGRPEWAGFFSEGEYQRFMQMVERDLSARLPPGQMVMDDGIVTIRGFGESESTLGLQNLAQKCRLVPSEEWQEVIAEHLRIAFGAAEHA